MLRSVSRQVGRRMGRRTVFSSAYTVDLPIGVPFTEYILENSGTFADKPALVDGPTGRTIKYSELGDRIGSAATALEAEGFDQDSTLAILLPNMPEYVLAFNAPGVLGGRSTTINPQYSAEEISRQLEDSNATHIVTTPQLLGNAAPAVDALEADVKIHVFDPENGPDCFLDAQGAGPRATAASVKPDETVLVLPYSSGTTGLPKGTMLSHFNITSNLEQLSGNPDFNLAMDANDTVIGLLPFFHIYGMTVVMSAALRVGATVVTMPQFDPTAFVQTMVKHQVSWAPLVPPIMLFMAKHPAVANLELPHLKHVFSGAAPLDASLQQAFMERFPGANARQGYGMTESSPVIHITAPDDLVPGSVGNLVPNTEAKLLDADGNEVTGTGAEAVGELCVRGPQVMLGYLNRPEATAATLDDEKWLHTGDIGYMDEHGHFYIVDRAKELIKVKGFQVAPAELEGVLLQHAAIADAAVIGIPDERSGERPKAFVVRAEGSDITEEDVKAHVAAHLAKYKHLAQVQFIDAVPKSAAGKILRKDLRDL